MRDADGTEIRNGDRVRFLSSMALGTVMIGTDCDGVVWDDSAIWNQSELKRHIRLLYVIRKPESIKDQSW